MLRLTLALALSACATSSEGEPLPASVVQSFDQALDAQRACIAAGEALLQACRAGTAQRPDHDAWNACTRQVVDLRSGRATNPGSGTIGPEGLSQLKALQADEASLLAKADEQTRQVMTTCGNPADLPTPRSMETPAAAVSVPLTAADIPPEGLQVGVPQPASAPPITIAVDGTPQGKVLGTQVVRTAASALIACGPASSTSAFTLLVADDGSVEVEGPDEPSATDTCASHVLAGLRFPGGGAEALKVDITWR